MDITEIGRFHSPLKGKFGIPRQSGIAGSLEGYIELSPEFSRREMFRGIEGFSHLWLLWGFSENGGTWHATVRPPRLGGNARIGVFATRSPFRPNGIGLSCVRLSRIELPRIYVLGADLMDGTPVYDIKPYLAYTDSHPDASAGFTGEQWPECDAVFSEEAEEAMKRHFKGNAGKKMDMLRELLSQDPRPKYHDDPERVYGMAFEDGDIHFRVKDNILTVISFEPARHNMKEES